MKIEVSKVLIISVIILFITIAGVYLSYAYGTASPSTLGHTAGEIEGAVPSGFCVFSSSATSCPAGWTRSTSFDGKAIRGSDTAGGVGGAESHYHVTDIQKTSAGGSGSNVMNDVALPTNWQSNWPPYINVLICCKD